MARAIAHITGTALRPGVSRNKRWYKPEHIAGAVASAQQRIGEGAKPMVMLSFHGAEDNSREITAALTSMTLAEDGSAQFGADIIGTEAGRDIAALADSTDGKPALSTVSIRGAWTGKVRRERGPSGELVETADGLELDGIDWTKSPGVDGAEIATFAWAAEGQNETSERVLITESVEVAEMVVESGETTESAPEVPEGAREAFAALFGQPVDEASLPGTVSMSKRKTGMSGSGRKYADPGYQADKKQRYDITDKAHAVVAWRYIHQAGKAAKYTAAQLKNIRSRIRAALTAFGVKTAAEAELAGWTFETWQVSDEVAEFYGDPSKAGSWCISASNGPVSLNLSCYGGMDPADLHQVLPAAAAACCDTLAALDPDMDGDVDVAPGGDTDGDGGHESAEDGEDLTEAEDEPEEDVPATETIPDAQADGESPAPAGTQEMEDPAMAEETTNEAGGAAPAGLTLEGVTQAFVTALNARDEAKEQRKQAKRDREAREAAEATARKTALTEALAELGIVPTQAAPAATEAAPAATETAPLSEADVAKRVEEGVTEALTEFKQQLIASGAILPSRTGVVIKEHAIPEDEAPTGEDLRAKNDDDLMNYLGGAMAQQADKIRPIG